MRPKRYIVAVLAGFVAGSLLAGITLPELARCNSDSEKPAFLFPYAFLPMWVFDFGIWPLLGLVLAQFPIYAAILVAAMQTPRPEKAIIRLVVLHLILGVGCSLLYSTGENYRSSRDSSYRKPTRTDPVAVAAPGA